MKLAKHISALIAAMSLFSLSVFPESNPKINWEKLRRSWEDYQRYPSGENAMKVAYLLPDKHITGRDIQPGDKTIDFIFSASACLEYQIFVSNKCAVILAYRLFSISDGAYTEDLLANLSSLVRINPRLFLEELKAHRKLEAVQRLGLIVDMFPPNYFEYPTAEELERQLRIKALESVKDKGLVQIRDECIAVLKSLNLTKAEKKK